MKRAIIGAGGFAREVKSQMLLHNSPFFVEDDFWNVNMAALNIWPLYQFNPEEYEVVIAIADPQVRNRIRNTLPPETKYYTLIHPSVQILGAITNIGEGSIICAGCILTENIQIGNHCHLNLMSTIGHDCVIGDFFTTAPGAKISGNCGIGDRVYIGTNSATREKIKITDDVTIGMMSGVIKDITQPGTYVGTPAKLIEL